MSASILARRYGKALLDLASESGDMDRVAKDLDAFSAAWEASPELREAFENPAVSSKARRDIIGALAKRIEMLAMVKNTLLILSERRRMRYVPELALAYQTMAEEKKGRVRAEIVAATKLSNAYCKQLQSTLESVTGKKVVLKVSEDPSLIGGVVARVGDKIFDGSVKNRLSQLKNELLEG